MGTLAIFGGILALLTVVAMWGTKLAAKAQTAKSIGDLLNEESEANDRLQTHVDVLRDTPADGANNQRLRDKWTRPE